MPWHNGGQSRTSTTAWKALKRAVVARDGNRCSRCGAPGTGTRLELDHIRPVAEGGRDTLDNAQLLCGPCHLPKSQAEARRGKARRAARRRLPEGRHPGYL
ncbi:HNH endonuclease [Rhodococcus aetherivorans]|uniref:HNH endonuclease n=1 Tax=Rhodococcus aetherivorans TaxID=191292 RepID=UPI00389101E6